MQRPDQGSMQINILNMCSRRTSKLRSNRATNYHFNRATYLQQTRATHSRLLRQPFCLMLVPIGRQVTLRDGVLHCLHGPKGEVD